VNFYAEFVEQKQNIGVRCVAFTSATNILAVMGFVYFAVKHCVEFVVNTMQFQIALYAAELSATNVVSK